MIRATGDLVRARKLLEDAIDATCMIEGQLLRVAQDRIELDKQETVG